MPNDKKLKAMQEGGKILALILEELKKRTVIGTKTSEIDDWAKRLCLKYKVKPSFLNYDGYPAAICISVNDEIVHGIPGERVIENGDLVSLDFGVKHDGYHTDSAISFIVGTGTQIAEKLLVVTKESLMIGIKEAKVGNHIGDIGAAIERYVNKSHFGIVRVLVGHGIGRNVHEEPLIPNFGRGGEGPEIKEGMTLAIEPMITGSSYEVCLADDGWTYKTMDQSLAAHFEHTIYVSKEGPIILTKIN